MRKALITNSKENKLIKSPKANDNLLTQIESDLIAACGASRARRATYSTFLALLTDILKTEEVDYGA